MAAIIMMIAEREFVLCMAGMSWVGDLVPAMDHNCERSTMLPDGFNRQDGPGCLSNQSSRKMP